MNDLLLPTMDPETAHRDGAVSDLQPVVELLYHPDLSRIGTSTESGLFSVPEAPVVFGRAVPDFVGETGGRHPITDPCISRHQLSIAWCPDVLCFKVEAPEDTRRPVGVVDLEGVAEGGGAPVINISRIKRVRLVEPGSCLAVGDRLLLWLDVRADRLGAQRMGMVGESNTVWGLREDIARIADLERPVMVQGETGAGKELVARALHGSSRRRHKPWHVLNCGALPETLVESTLFGHTKGAFTGAERDQRGAFEAADGSTLFLDEIGELPLGVQQKLLRVLQEGSIIRVGEVTERQVDVRVIAATNRELKAEVAEGRFREDLYYRLASHTLRVPPLRSHPEDIPRLFFHFLKARGESHPALKRLWRPVDRFNPPIPMAFVLGLMHESWPGNVRQLQNAVEQTVQLNLHDGDFTTPRWRDTTSPRPAPPPGPAQAQPAQPTASKASPVPMGDNTLANLSLLGQGLGISRRTLTKLLGGVLAEDRGRLLGIEELESLTTRCLQEHLEAHEYRQGRVSRELGVSRTTLHKLMERLGFPRPKDLDPQSIEHALSEAGGDLLSAARSLKVSPRGLRLRMSEFDEKGS